MCTQRQERSQTSALTYKLPSLTFPKEAFSQLNDAIGREWLLTNGLGSYASSTIVGINTRKYHGLLIAALTPPGDRTVCLAKLDEDVTLGEETFRLGANEFQNSVFPDGYKLIKQFNLEPYPTYHYDLGKVAVQKTLFLPKKKNAVVLLYNVSNFAEKEATVKLYPLLTCRHYHTVFDHNQTPLKFTQNSSTKAFQVAFTQPQASTVCRITEGQFHEGFTWVERLRYREETARGESDLDDCFQPGHFELNVPVGATKNFAVSCAVDSEAQAAWQTLDEIGNTTQQIDAVLSKECQGEADLLANFYRSHPDVPPSDWLNWILMAAESFMVQNTAGRKSIIAGYYWFEPWGRDTFISLPGLLLVTGKFGDAKDILLNFMRFFKDGMIPNLVDDKTGVPLYNTVDGTLWYVNTVMQYLKYSGDWNFVRTELWEKLKEIIDYHEHGTAYGIHVEEDGLLMHGPQLTWMDAVVDGNPVTPRAGKAVEVQALWYNALKTMELLAGRFGDDALADKYDLMAERAMGSFNDNFWNPNLGCLYDVEPSDGVDASVRPNQILAVSLDYTMLNPEISRRVVEVVERELVTPYGLRTLSMDDPKFVGQYVGDRRSRDSAYHNGTIWPWLLGPYVSAYLKVNDYSAEARKEALEKLILPLFTVGIHQGGLGTINEVYDSNPPNAPRGCVAQAWSIAELLRAYVEDVLQVKPKLTL